MSLASTLVIDAKGLILGRMASVVAKRLLRGEKIIIINAEKAVLSGKRVSRVREAKTFLEVGHPKKGPFHYRRPDRIVRRTIRGMLPRKKAKGQRAYKSLRVYIGAPTDLGDQTVQTILDASVDRLKCPFLTVGEIAKEIGWTPGVE
jgi:large subunit ribosomal protein L13